MAVPVLRFLIHDIRAVFLLFTLSIYLALCTIHCLFGYLIHKNGDSMRTKANIIFAPLHIAFLATMVIGMVKNDYSAMCSEETVLPVIFYVASGLFGLLFVVTLNCFFVEYMLK